MAIKLVIRNGMGIQCTLNSFVTTIGWPHWCQTYLSVQVSEFHCYCPRVFSNDTEVCYTEICAPYELGSLPRSSSAITKEELTRKHQILKAITMCSSPWHQISMRNLHFHREIINIYLWGSAKRPTEGYQTCTQERLNLESKNSSM